MLAGGPGQNAELTKIYVERGGERIWGGEALQAAISQSLSRLLGKTAIPHVRVKPEILGGLIVDIEGDHGHGAVGNIGDPLCDAVGSTWDALVVEASHGHHPGVGRHAHDVAPVVADGGDGARDVTTVVAVGSGSAAGARVLFHDPDRVAVGDFHLKHMGVHHLTGKDRGTDEEMLELLEPYRPNRRRAVMLLKQ